LLFAQTENYAEYNRYGNVVKTQDKAIAKSKYNEDEYVNNHKSVWGSFFKEDKWGYKCCHFLDRNSYCTGVIETPKEED
jgi:pre-mRNA-processing factor SLU7